MNTLSNWAALRKGVVAFISYVIYYSMFIGPDIVPGAGGFVLIFTAPIITIGYMTFSYLIDYIIMKKQYPYPSISFLLHIALGLVTSVFPGNWIRVDQIGLEHIVKWVMYALFFWFIDFLIASALMKFKNNKSKSSPNESEKA
ncbi:hypothetical protein [Thermoactinomyces sp. DSM 45892]|uniref:hypothetical protein n=1 Tax=Thermoactinomyces sp. DSM 45892 TaxID=1882753 RepID=UPI00089AA501|nr:hypothetical protein [Thermoactinomyces sp. DSM 45892]SDY40358.1 hypothetical protein SAMN05444416_104162 [Thermoactinomyces sp. DSM 45892]